jgi:GNAT superfamily N-acetyltransferase
MHAVRSLKEIKQMKALITIREIQESDREAWDLLWDGYNAFYKRVGPTALDQDISNTTWGRFFDPNEPMYALVAELDGKILGFTHYLFHRSTTRIEPVCYLQDLFTVPEARGQGVGRTLIEAVYVNAKASGVKRVYWQTHQSNSAGRLLYDRVAKHYGFIVYAFEF